MMKTYNTYREIQPTATGICPIGTWNGKGVLYLKEGSEEII
jgi:hypothetical protein